MSKSIATVVGWYGGYPVIEPIDAWVPTVGAVLYSAPAPISWSAAAYYVDGKTYFPEEPPACKPLTDEDISAIVQSMSAYTWDAHMLARAIERAHGIGSD